MLFLSLYKNGNGIATILEYRNFYLIFYNNNFLDKIYCYEQI